MEKIKNHPIYNKPNFKTEREILLKLTEICGFDQEFGIIDYFSDSPTIDIGIIDQERIENRKMPCFQKGTKVQIKLFFLSENNPIYLFDGLSFAGMNTIILPILQNLKEIMRFLTSYYEGEYKQLCIESYERLFEEKINI